MAGAPEHSDSAALLVLPGVGPVFALKAATDVQHIKLLGGTVRRRRRWRAQGRDRTRAAPGGQRCSCQEGQLMKEAERRDYCHYDEVVKVKEQRLAAVVSLDRRKDIWPSKQKGLSLSMLLEKQCH